MDEAIARLAHAAVRQHPYHPDHSTGAARESATLYGRDLLAKSAADGGMHTLGTADDLRAYLAWYHVESDPFLGAAITRVCHDHVLGDAKAEAWLLEHIAALAPTLGDDAEVLVEPCYRHLARAWLSHDFHLSSVMLLGQTAPALERLMAARNPPRSLDHLGLTVRPSRPDDADGLVDLQRRVFRSEPAYCWFGGNDRCLEAWRERFITPSETREQQIDVIEDDGVILGLFNVDHKMNPMWGHIGGFGLIFDTPARGRGIIKSAYRRMLEQLVAWEAPLFRGSTARVQVMGLGEIMGRSHSGWTLRRENDFEVSHWGTLAV